jgi:hypothetical protein
VFFAASRKKQTGPLKGHFHIGHGWGVEALGNHAILHRDRPGQILSDEQFLSVRYPTPKTARPHIGEALCRICLDMTVRWYCGRVWGDSDMAKKRIASVDLGWIILEQLKDEKEFLVGMSLAVIPDEESGWRTIINAKDRKYMRPSVERRLAAVEKKLQSIYTLAIWGQAVQVNLSSMSDSLTSSALGIEWCEQRWSRQ